MYFTHKMSNNDFPSHAVSPCFIDGLAAYSLGEGPATLLMPYPHGFSTTSTAESPLAHIALQLNQQVVTFDPPGAFRSTRPARLHMAEMLEAAEETLQAFDLHSPLTVIGHSMGGLCAIAYTLAYPARVQRLVLIGSVSGGPGIVRGRGMPWE